MLVKAVLIVFYLVLFLTLHSMLLITVVEVAAVLLMTVVVVAVATLVAMLLTHKAVMAALPILILIALQKPLEVMPLLKQIAQGILQILGQHMAMLN